MGLKINTTKANVIMNGNDARQITLITDILAMIENYIYLGAGGNEIGLG